MSDPAASFDAVSRQYDSARPSYPRECVQWMVDDRAETVVDVGAGTGKLTRLLQRAGRRVIAVEPSPGMLEQLRRALPTVEAIQGTGERMPLPDASADAIVYAQAWHWVDVSAASLEAGRVLRAGGTLGLVWNLRDERVPWVRALGTAMRADGDHFRGGEVDAGVDGPFGEPERTRIEWVRVCSRDEILADVRSRSYFALLPSDEQRNVLADVIQALPGERLELPYVTAALRYRRP